MEQRAAHLHRILFSIGYADVGRMKAPWGADVSENKQDSGVGDCCHDGETNKHESVCMRVCIEREGQEGIVVLAPLYPTL